MLIFSVQALTDLEQAVVDGWAHPGALAEATHPIHFKPDVTHPASIPYDQEQMETCHALAILKVFLHASSKIPTD